MIHLKNYEGKMPIEAKLTNDGEILIISVIGNFDFSVVRDFRGAYSDGDYQHCKIMVDLNHTTSMDSSALGMLLAMQLHFNRPDGDIHILNANNEVSKILDISHFGEKFTLD